MPATEAATRLPAEMLALRWHDRGDIRLDTVSTPLDRPGRVIVEVAWCGLCGTDLKEYSAGPVFIPVSEHPVTGRCAPMTLGHEFAGRVVSAGDAAAEGLIGQRVAVDLAENCDWCPACHEGQYVRCENLGFIGTANDGAFASYVSVPSRRAHVLPDSISDEVGALIEPLAFAVHAVRRSGLLVGDSVTIIGGGPIGLLVAKVVRAAGAAALAVVEPSQRRRALAREAGADFTIDPADGPADQQIRSLEGFGGGSDIAFECVGKPTTLQDALRSTRKGGTVVLGGIFGHDTGDFSFNDVVLSERRIVGTLAYNNDFPRAIALVAGGHIDVDDMITARIPLRRIVEDGFEALLRDRDQHLKILVTPSTV